MLASPKLTATDERAHMLDMLHHLNEGDVLVLDRGYPSHGVLQAFPS